MTSTAAVEHVTAERQRPLLLFFHSPTQGQSRRVEAFMAQVLQRRHNHESFTVRRINVHERPDLAERFRISSTPTFMVVVGNRVQRRLENPRHAQQIQEALQEWLRT